MNWEEKYLEVAEEFSRLDLDKTFLTGFNANIDRVVRVEEFLKDEEVDEKDHEKVENIKKLKEVLAYCKKNGKNKEIDINSYKPKISGGDIFIGGQGGIVSAFAEKAGFNSILYTPFLSKELVENLPKTLSYFDGEKIDVIGNSVNSEKFKENIIFEFEGKNSGRVILSDDLPGFKPFFKGLAEKNLGKIDEKVDRFFFSGFHHMSKKHFNVVERQLKTIKSPIHVEYVYTSKDRSVEMVEKVLPNAESIGMDEDEFEQILEALNYHEQPESIEEYVDALVFVKDELAVERIHLHTYAFHIMLLDKDFPTSPEVAHKSMFLGEIAAIASAGLGNIPERDDIEGIDLKNTEFRGIEEVERVFGDGIIDHGDYHLLAIPILIHKNPKRLVGLGDTISSGSFFGEEVF